MDRRVKAIRVIRVRIEFKSWKSYKSQGEMTGVNVVIEQEIVQCL